ncbi:copper resistance protein B [Cyanobacterium aponinum UTEX 3222]|uniref:copper resistance protein B n=1 Tax=Cyanobacterium aponinum TaxID=379064 RepID=UPI002B4BB82F|nr:copper resistance protein B [Cyanobacterium aponinum]WRL37583.1 copper resistance protein B [Cyanobacterium aponinum UTEX 3221]WRL41150.1 copper resistance protein B [Cyanobacterium aponinum UTEX 3222]
MLSLKYRKFLVQSSLISLVSFNFLANDIQAQEVHQFTLQKSFNTYDFNLENNVQEKEIFFKQFTDKQSLTPENSLIFAQHNDNQENDFGDPIHDNQIFYKILFDQLEYQVNDNQNIFNWDIQGWIGGDYQKLWVKTEGDVSLDDGNGEAELQLLYSKMISPYFDFQTGLRYDQLYGDKGNSRGFAVIGIEGLAPYFFEVDSALFISHQGDISARFKAEYELLLSQRLILQPTVETNLAIQKVEEFGIGSGINNLELGLRLRYEISREFAPYIGVSWNKLFGDTAKFAEEEGESSDDLKFVTGVRLMF